jgi:ABC-type sugar transport system permease subunit
MTIVVALVATLILLLMGILVAVLVWRKRKREGEQETNYRVFFVMGIALVPIGVALMIAGIFTDMSTAIGAPFLIIGTTYISLGLANRDKWKGSSQSS